MGRKGRKKGRKGSNDSDEETQISSVKAVDEEADANSKVASLDREGCGEEFRIQWRELTMDHSGARLDQFVARALGITRSRGKYE